MKISELIDFIEQLPNIKEDIRVNSVEVSVAFLADHISKDILKKVIEEVPFDFYVMENKIYFQRN